DARLEHEQLKRDLTDLCDALGDVSLGDLSAVPAVSGDAHPTAAVLAVALADTVVALRRLARGISSSGEAVASEAGHLLASAEELAAGATQQASSVTEVTSTVDQLAATSNQIAETAQSVAQFAAATLRFADDGQVAVSESVTAMDGIAARVENIA